MLKLFKRKKEPKIKEHIVADKAASLFAKAVLNAQTKWANWLSAREQKMSLHQKKKALHVYFVTLSILTLLFIYKVSFNKQEQSSDWLKQPAIILPEDTRLPDSLNLEYLRELYKQRKAQQSLFDSTHH